MEFGENVLQIWFMLSLWWDFETMEMGKYWWAITYCYILKVKQLVIIDSQRQDKEDTHQMHTVISLQYCPNDNGGKLATAVNQWAYVNPATQVSVYSPVDPSPAINHGAYSGCDS